MKKSMIKYYFFIAIIMVVSCKKDFLDKVPPTALPSSTAINSEASMLTALTGTYAQLRNANLYGRTLPVIGDLKADNTYVTSSNSGRYITTNNYAYNSSDADALGVWQNGYMAIKYANTIINAGALSGPVNAANVAQYQGEAYAIRALMHFELVRCFGTAYTVDATKPGVPIVLNYNQDALPARNTVKEVYKQVISDLEKAYSLMTQYRGTAYLSKYAARAIEARVYQNMGDWANAKITALDVVSNSGWSLLSSSSYVAPSGSLGTSGNNSTYSPGGYWANYAPQNSTSKNETLFEVVSDAVNNNVFDQIGFIYLTIGSGYGDILGTDGLYNLYSSTDVRRGLNPNAGAGYRSGQAGITYLCYKYPNPANASGKDNTKVIRLSDVILILAEAYYNANDITNANLYLNKVAQQRDPSFLGWSDTGSTVLEDILIERRKELAFEGSRYWDLVRLQRSWTKIKNLSPLTTVSVTQGNLALLFPIPLTETNANTNITQNPGY